MIGGLGFRVRSSYPILPVTQGNELLKFNVKLCELNFDAY